MKVTLKLDLKVDRATGILGTGFPGIPQGWSLPSAAVRTGTQSGEQEPGAWRRKRLPYSYQPSVENSEPTVGF